MLTRLMVILFLSPTTLLGLWGCGEKTMSPELARQAASFYATATALAAESPTPVVDEVVLKLREELDRNPEKLAERLASDEAEDADFEGVGDVPDWRGKRDFFIINGNRLNCEEPGKDRPTRCFRIGETAYWACNGQILRDCPECPEPTPPTPTPTGVVPTVTPTQQSCCTAVPPTGVPPTTTNQPTATTNPPTGVPPTATWTPPTTQPTPYGTATCVPTPSTKPCEDQNVDFWAKPSLASDKYGTDLLVPGNGHHVRLPDTVNWQKVQDEVRMCQVHVVNAHSVHDLITGKTLTGCVLAYRQGLTGNDEYRQVRYEAIDGYGYHINTPNVGFGLQEGGTQGTLALLSARKQDGTYACRIPGDTRRPGAQDIQLMELGLEGR